MPCSLLRSFQRNTGTDVRYDSNGIFYHHEHGDLPMLKFRIDIIPRVSSEEGRRVCLTALFFWQKPYKQVYDADYLPAITQAKNIVSCGVSGYLVQRLWSKGIGPFSLAVPQVYVLRFLQHEGDQERDVRSQLLRLPSVMCFFLLDSSRDLPSFSVYSCTANSFIAKIISLIGTKEFCASVFTVFTFPARREIVSWRKKHYIAAAIMYRLFQVSDILWFLLHESLSSNHCYAFARHFATRSSNVLTLGGQRSHGTAPLWVQMRFLSLRRSS